MAPRRITSAAARVSAAVAIAAAAAAAAPTAARGSPLDDATAGRAVFTGAASPHATSILLNPAALALGLTGVHFYTGGTATITQTSIDRRIIGVDGQVTDGDSVSAFDWGPGATFGLWTVTSSRNLAVGGLLMTPSPADRFPDDPALRYQSLGGLHRTTELGTLAAAYRVIRRIYVGGSVSLTRTRVKLSFMRDTALEAGRDPATGVDSDCGGAPCGIENPLAAQRFELDVSPRNVVAADNLTYRISALGEVYPDWWIGATFRLPSIGMSLEGGATVTAAPRDGGETQSGRAIVNFDLPATLDIELRARITPGYDLHVGGRWADQSKLADYDVRLLGFDAGVPAWIERPRGYQDYVRTWAGVEQVDVGQKLLGGVRLGFATPQVPIERVSPTTIERWSLTADVGGQWRISRNLIVQLSYGLDFRPRVDVTDSQYDPTDRLACIDSGYDYSTEACENVRDGYAIPTAAGTYQRFEHAFRLGLRYDIQ
jgi:long-subunit fatty acid transport protein